MENTRGAHQRWAERVYANATTAKSTTVCAATVNTRVAKYAKRAMNFKKMKRLVNTRGAHQSLVSFADARMAKRQQTNDATLRTLLRMESRPAAVNAIAGSNKSLVCGRENPGHTLGASLKWERVDYANAATVRFTAVRDAGIHTRAAVRAKKAIRCKKKKAGSMRGAKRIKLSKRRKQKVRRR